MVHPRAGAFWPRHKDGRDQPAGEERWKSIPKSVRKLLKVSLVSASGVAPHAGFFFDNARTWAMSTRGGCTSEEACDAKTGEQHPKASFSCAAFRHHFRLTGRRQHGGSAAE
jgi:hypothetical protein